MEQSSVQDESIETSKKRSVKIIIDSIENIVSFFSNYFIIIKNLTFLYGLHIDYERRS